MAKLNLHWTTSCWVILRRVETEFYLKCLLISFLLILFLQAPAEPSQPSISPGTDSIKVPASTRYKAGLFRKLLIGSNYRKVWSTPVNMPVFNLKEGGYKIVELGGGQQTKSLRMVDAKGVEWVLRTVDKDVEKALPKGLRNTPAEAIVQDLVSSAHPYAPLVIAPMAKALGVAAPDPLLFVVPDDPAFGPHQALFAHRVVYLERRDPTPDFTDSKNTASVQENLAKKDNDLVLQKQVLKARLLDMLIADWDRHADQWRWGIKDSAGRNYYYAIPRDRDQAFFRATGIIPRIAKAIAMHHINWFKKNTTGLDKLNFKSREFDRIFLNDLDEQDWKEVIQEFQTSLSDPVINHALVQLPPEIYKISGAFLDSRLKSRRDGMAAPVMGYYRQLAKEVQVWGTEGPELFEVLPEGDGMRVKVYALNKQGLKKTERYNRYFTRTQTKDVHLEGLGGNDRFEIGSLSPKIPNLHLYGMKGNDVFVLSGGKHPRITVHQRKNTEGKQGGSSAEKDVAEN